MDVWREKYFMKLPLDKEIFEELVPKVKDWAVIHGAGMRSKTNFNLDTITFAPFTLLPTPFPRLEFEKALSIQTLLNELIHKVAHDREFLTETLASTIQADDFMRRLFRVYETVQTEGVAQEVSAGLFRGDYLLDKFQSAKIKQVEINTISASFAGVSSQLLGLHRFVLSELGYSELSKNLPENQALTGLCHGLIKAWKMYGKAKTIMLFVVEDVTYNICDQRFHEFEIRRMSPEIYIIRRTLTEVFERGYLDDRKRLIIDNMEIAVVYFRCGYEPSQFKGESEWEALLLLERSYAIKCPPIHYHLAGTKKVQQALAKPNVLERFLKSSKKAETIREIYTGIYSLEFDQFGNEAVERALRNPEKFVLKPQREGGGNNVYGIEVRHKIEELSNSNEKSAWILMSRIVPPVQKSYIIRPGVEVKFDQLQEVVSELGIFGIIIGDHSDIYLNRQVGHMLRTKPSTADEGGVAAGEGCLDSPFLID